MKGFITLDPWLWPWPGLFSGSWRKEKRVFEKCEKEGKKKREKRVMLERERDEDC